MTPKSKDSTWFFFEAPEPISTTGPTGQCPSCGLDVPLLAPDDLRAHIHLTNGEYCPGSRGAPIASD